MFTSCIFSCIVVNTVGRLVFFSYVYIIISYPKSSFCNVRTGICSYRHSWEEGLKHLNQWERNQTQLSLEKVGCIEAGAGGLVLGMAGH